MTFPPRELFGIESTKHADTLLRIRSSFFQLISLLSSLLLVGCQREENAPPVAPPVATVPQTNNVSEQFLRLMNAGKNYFDQGDATNALATFQKAAALVPHDLDARLNLANAFLLADSSLQAVREADEALKLERNSAAAYFIKGSAFLRLGEFEEALKALENANRIEPGQTATLFQIGRARMGLRQFEEAIAAFRAGLALEPNRLHTSARYLLGRALLQAGRQAEAEEQLIQHQAALEENPGAGVAAFERSKYTQARVPFRLDQPALDGVAVRFLDETSAVFADSAAKFSGPVGILDPNRTGWNSLFVHEKGQGFRLLWNTNGTFTPDARSHPASAEYSRVLIGDLQNDRFDDVIVLGPKGSHLFSFATNGQAADLSTTSGLSSLRAIDGLLIDLDFTGKLDLLAVGAATNDLRLHRQFGPLTFMEVTTNTGIPASLRNARGVLMQDWNSDENMDVVVARAEDPPLLLEKVRGGPLIPRTPTNWPAGASSVAGDFDNDLRPDLAVLGGGRITICYNSGAKVELPLPQNHASTRLTAIDYDNDGWLDLWAVGHELRAWRNRGTAGFIDQSAQLGLKAFKHGPAAELHFADFDRDCDSDAIVALAGGGLRYLRNDGGNSNSQVKVQLVGNRSNASGLGCKVEIETGGLRLIRTVQQLPVEIGVGKHQVLDSFLVHWFNWPQGMAEVPVDCREPLLAIELTIQEGSCPYLYAWDGLRFRFVTDILGSAPLGLPVAQGRYVEGDPEEFVWIGGEQTFPPRDGEFVLQITEELREVLYLDEAKLVVVDHEPGVEIHSTDKLRPSKPFPPGELIALHNERPLRMAETFEGRAVTDALRAVDGRRVSPPRLRSPQLRGLAEPHGVTLDFGPLDHAQPLVLVLNGWLRFGGGMANIAASHDPSLPFPFPRLEMETASGEWRPIDVVVGAPSGKTKSIVVDLDGKLAPGSRRLRLSTAFEIHWDRIALLEKKSARPSLSIHPPSRADLHFRGFSALENLPPDWPLTPDYAKVSPNFYWTLIPGGWCTRYGDLTELLASSDEALALINAGDELTLAFAADSLPPKTPGLVRQFFLYIDGWDKDSDFHVAAGTQVEPLPFHAMDYQQYGRQQRPPFPSDQLHKKYNTRWVEGRLVQQARGQ